MYCTPMGAPIADSGIILLRAPYVRVQGCPRPSTEPVRLRASSTLAGGSQASMIRGAEPCWIGAQRPACLDPLLHGYSTFSLACSCLAG